MTFLDDFDGTDENSADRIKPEIRALIRRGNVTPAEVAELRCNSWEWEALIPAMNDEAFVKSMQHALDNCFTQRQRPFTTYNQAVEGLYAPELLKRFAAVKLKADEQGRVACELFDGLQRIKRGPVVAEGEHHPDCNMVRGCVRGCRWKYPSDIERTCEFCGCNTNAHQRRCCDAGAEADRKTNERARESLNEMSARIAGEQMEKYSAGLPRIEYFSKKPSFTYDEVVQILKNVGRDVTCGACAAIAFTGVGMPGDAHTCGL